MVLQIVYTLFQNYDVMLVFTNSSHKSIVDADLIPTSEAK